MPLKHDGIDAEERYYASCNGDQSDMVGHRVLE